MLQVHQFYGVLKHCFWYYFPPSWIFLWYINILYNYACFPINMIITNTNGWHTTLRSRIQDSYWIKTQGVLDYDDNDVWLIRQWLKMLFICLKQHQRILCIFCSWFDINVFVLDVFLWLQDICGMLLIGYGMKQLGMLYLKL